ncbi:SDR family NAD(P)-dependent oxidoreductase [Thalassotalea sp. 1_MG-2023]|uniref:SDR family NAD(P)-dependent oxidoreductase n=1 Tax=Thalassotalea sp. 1_MG-2023 TaxID=3062680 RepID=UPI0026E19221|nr:SDR family NAD(P)-dependent oxidoreductase [Thalassotalea sp. 1_MG-2023]MDO6426711.1 SDR family NAD(P)-dependent oxidoreductase [Thalassotalea sp. 1_MG-2023]
MKTILITDATDGIGFETAKALVAQGHRLLIHGRNEEKLANTLQRLNKANPTTPIQGFLADLTQFYEVNQLINDIKQKANHLDIIINNAGVLKTKTVKTNESLDVRFLVNTLSPYVLTLGLIDLLADNGRIVNLSSAAQASVNIDALMGNIALNDAFQAYAQSKLAITIWSQELTKELNKKQVSVAVNPGSLLASKMVKEGFGMTGNDLTIGSDILVRAALSDEFDDASGKYYDNDAKQFSLPHIDAQKPEICAQVMAAINVVIKEKVN